MDPRGERDAQGTVGVEERAVVSGCDVRRWWYGGWFEWSVIRWYEDRSSAGGQLAAELERAWSVDGGVVI